MGAGEILLGHASGGAPVYLWPGYGVVCPDLVTTNGNPFVLLRSWGRPVDLTPAGSAWFVGWAFWLATR